MNPDFRSSIYSGSPLLPLSPHRENERNQPQHARSPSEECVQRLTPSTSLSSLSNILHGRSSHAHSSSDVQGKVAQFNGLAKDAAQRRKDNEAALRRAIVGREEAESDCKRYKDRSERLYVDIEEARDREKRVAHRLEEVQVC